MQWCLHMQSGNLHPEGCIALISAARRSHSSNMAWFSFGSLIGARSIL
jgi:hypothetical protein